MRARAERAEGLSYAEIARRQNVTPTAVYYALHPDKRNGGLSDGKQRSFYSTAALWDAVCEIAWGERVSISSVVSDILTGKRPPVSLDV